MMEEEMIRAYVEAYNNFDVEGMMRHMHPQVVFKNLVDGNTVMELDGKVAFQEQAEKNKSFFSERAQTITELKKVEDAYELSIDYEAVLAQDIPEGPVAGTRMAMQGKSVFRFKDGQIISLEDISEAS